MLNKMVNHLKIKTFAIVAVIMIAFGVSEAFSQVNNLYRMESLFIYNFTKHVKWENNSNETFTVGIFGNEIAFKEIKDNLGSKMVWGKKINIIQINSTSDVNNCHIAFFPKSNKKKIVDVIDAANTANTLVVTEDDLVSNGAAISFVFEQSKMNFKISKEKIEHAGLKVSNSLMSIGIPV